MEKFKKVFEREIVKIMRDDKVPGMSVYITKEGEPIYERAFGIREKGASKPTTINTLYGVSSITKSITSMAILQLHDKNKLNIHNPISEYLPIEIGFKDKPITPHHLMSHSSGIPALHTFYSAQMNQDLYPSKTPVIPLGNWDDFYFHLNSAKDELISPPGTKYYYSNEAFAILSLLISEVSGQTYQEYVSKNILKPLEMERSTYSLSKANKDPDSAKGFNFVSKNDKINRSPKDLLSSEFIAGSGGLISSVVEMTNYLQCHLNNGEFKGKRILDEELIQEMRKPHNRNIASSYDNYCLGCKKNYGYGLNVYEDYHGYTVITHGGVSGVTGGQIGFIPKLNVTFSQLYNVSFLSTYPLHTALTYFVGKNPEDAMPFYKKRKHFKNLCGKYEAYKKILTIEVSERNGLLYLKGDFWDNRLSHPIIPKTNTPENLDFYALTPYGRMEVPFTIHKDGKITFEYERYLMHKKTFEKIEE